MECDYGTWNFKRGPWNVIMKSWNLNRGTCNAVMISWNVNRGPWNVTMGRGISKADRGM